MKLFPTENFTFFSKNWFFVPSWRKNGFRVLYVSLGLFFGLINCEKILIIVSFAHLKNLFLKLKRDLWPILTVPGFLIIEKIDPPGHTIISTLIFH